MVLCFSSEYIHCISQFVLIWTPLSIKKFSPYPSSTDLLHLGFSFHQTLLDSIVENAPTSIPLVDGVEIVKYAHVQTSPNYCKAAKCCCTLPQLIAQQIPCCMATLCCCNMEALCYCIAATMASIAFTRLGISEVGGGGRDDLGAITWTTRRKETISPSK